MINKLIWYKFVGVSKKMPSLKSIKKFFTRKKDKGRLYRAKTMKPFKIKKYAEVSRDDVKIYLKCYDLGGKDMTRYLNYSFVYNGIPGGFYLDTDKMRKDGL